MSRATGTPGRLAMPRRRGAATGLLIAITGAWCAIVPFIGHYFNFVVGPDNAWDMTTGRFWLSLVPGIVAVVGGLMLMSSGNRAGATLAAQLALAAGIWLVIGRELSHVWSSTWAEPPLGGPDKQALELLLYFFATGALIIALAGTALGRVTARHAGDVEALAAGAATDRAATADDGRTRGGRFRRHRDRDAVTEEETTRAPSAR